MGFLILAAVLLVLLLCAALRWDSSVQEWQVYAIWMGLVVCCGLWGVLEILGITFLRPAGIAGCLFQFGLMLFLEAFPSFGVEKARGDEKFLLVLGAPVLNDRPTPCLTSRAEAAASWMKRYPDTHAVLSGGKGLPRTEARTLEDEITARGIDRDRLTLEGESATTDENFQFSRPVLDSLGWRGEPLVVVTNRFHVFRLRHYAENSGFTHIRYLVTPTPMPVRFLWTFREVIVVLRWWVLGK